MYMLIMINHCITIKYGATYDATDVQYYQYHFPILAQLKLLYSCGVFMYSMVRNLGNGIRLVELKY